MKGRSVNRRTLANRDYFYLKITPSPQFAVATSSLSERQVDTIVSTAAQMNYTFFGSGLLSAQFLADSSVPTLLDKNYLSEVFPDYVSSMKEILLIIEPRDRSIDSSPTDRTEPKAQLRELDLMNCKLSALETIASAEVFPQPESSLDANASLQGARHTSSAFLPRHQFFEGKPFG